MIQYVQSVCIMSEKINYANCMKRRCEQCRYYDYCFRYRPKSNNKAETTIIYAGNKIIGKIIE